MYKKSHIEDMLLSTFYKREVITKTELWNFVLNLDPSIKDYQLDYIIVDLKRKGKLREVGRGRYTISDGVEFRPAPDKIITWVAEFLNLTADLEGPYDIWSTDWLNEFIELQATSTMYIVGIEKASMDRVFFSLQEQGSKKVPYVFLNPDRTVIEKYIAGTSELTVVTPIISRAPVEVRDKISFPTLEKILVDLFCDTDLFFAYQGSQLVKIFQAAFSKYPINFSRLFNYAKRRHREEDLTTYLFKNTDAKTIINSTKK
jgi:hypothetical protein